MSGIPSEYDGPRPERFQEYYVRECMKGECPDDNLELSLWSKGFCVSRNGILSTSFDNPKVPRLEVTFANVDHSDVVDSIGWRRYSEDFIRFQLLPEDARIYLNGDDVTVNLDLEMGIK